ncbi:alpha/beta hydrolase [Nocardioides sp.]|uniref:alpha/beta hydrolase n=1 Tax=Nocardioides sp. TaxID=35761 RepID=UPI0035641559
MSLLSTVERIGLESAMALPSRVQRLLAGRPIVLDGQTLATDVALMLRLQRLAREVGAETLPMDEAREAIRHHTQLSGGRQPIGSVRDLVAGDRPARLYVPSTPIPGALLVFFHGGGFMHGDLDSHDPACRFLSETSGVRVLAVDYRLGPEHRFPAAYDDAVAAHAWAVEHAAELGADPGSVGVGGDSAGGNLAAGVALEAARQGRPCRAQVLVYPATDARRDGASARLFAAGFYLTSEYMALADASYAASDADLDDPRYSPMRAEIPDGVAPALVFTAGFDPLRDEGEAYAERLREAGVAVEATRFEDQIHGFFNIVGVGRTSRRANRRIALATRLAFVD